MFLFLKCRSSGNGVGFINQQKIYFQSKLRNRPLNAEFTDYLYSNLVRHKANIGIVLTGIGYSSDDGEFGDGGDGVDVEINNDQNSFCLNCVQRNPIY